MQISYKQRNVKELLSDKYSRLRNSIWNMRKTTYYTLISSFAKPTWKSTKIFNIRFAHRL